MVFNVQSDNSSTSRIISKSVVKGISKLSVLNNVKRVLRTFGLDIGYNRMMVNGKRKSMYEYNTTPTIDSYVKRLEKGVEIELDF